MAPCTQLTCGHLFHNDCIEQLLTEGWPTLNITFGFLACPQCKTEMSFDYEVPMLTPLLASLVQLKAKATGLAIKVAREQGLDR